MKRAPSAEVSDTVNWCVICSLAINTSFFFCYCVSDMQDSPTEEDKYGTVKRVVPKPQAAKIHSPSNHDKTDSTPSPSSSPLIGSTPHSDANTSLVNESALLVGSTASDLSLLTDISLISDSSLLNDSTSLGSLCMTPTNGKMQHIQKTYGVIHSNLIKC